MEPTSKRHKDSYQMLWFFIVQLLTIASASTKSPLPQSKPHIIFILADDLGWYDVSWHNPKAITPNLESLASEGILLEQSYVQPLCTPTRSALLTGRYPFTIGREGKPLGSLTPTGLTLDKTTLPQSLKEAGYSTHAVGKWHLGFCNWDYTPTYRGFDTFYGFYLGSGDHYYHQDEGRGGETDTTHGYDFRKNDEPDFTANGTYDTYLYSNYVEDFLSSRDPVEPMFLYLAFPQVHTPLQAPAKYREPFSYIGDKDRQILLGMSYAMDTAVGRVVSALQATGHYDNSIIIFSSDNGGQKNAGINWPLRGSKGTLWEGGTRAPGFIHSPLLTRTGFTSNTVLHVTDWYATLMGLAGGHVPEDIDGFDMWEALTEGSESPRKSFVYNADYEEITPGEMQLNAAYRKGDYKIIVGDPGSDDEWTPPPEGLDSSLNIPTSNYSKEYFGGTRYADDIKLFNVIDDPEEREDISAAHEDIVQDMMADLQVEIQRWIPADSPAGDPQGDPKYFDGIWSPGWCEV